MKVKDFFAARCKGLINMGPLLFHCMFRLVLYFGSNSSLHLYISDSNRVWRQWKDVATANFHRENLGQKVTYLLASDVGVCHFFRGCIRM